MIFYDLSHGLTQKHYNIRMKSMFWNIALRQWLTTGLKNSPAVIRISVTVFQRNTTTPEHIDVMRKLFASDCHVMHDETEFFLNI